MHSTIQCISYFTNSNLKFISALYAARTKDKMFLLPLLRKANSRKNRSSMLSIDLPFFYLMWKNCNWNNATHQLDLDRQVGRRPSRWTPDLEQAPSLRASG
jgi:hypothetical protein